MSPDHQCCGPVLHSAVSRGPVSDGIRRSAFAGLRSGVPPRLSDLAAAGDQPLPVVREVVAELRAAGLATADGDLAGDPVVDGIDGLTLRTTPHRLFLAGRVLHTWCGFDTVGIAAALNVDAAVQTPCARCGAAIELVLSSGQPPTESLVVGWWPQVTGGPVNQTFCPAASLFCTQEHLEDWRPGASGAGEALSLTELAARGRATWAF